MGRRMGGTNVNETVGQRILAARNEQGMRQIDLAELVQVSDRSIQAYENDEVVPYRKMQEIAAILGVSVAWLLHGDRQTRLRETK
jgi:transcriptional regulator with XRE-family HTH domain